MQSPPSWCRNVRPYYNSDGFVVSANGESIGPLGIHSRFCDRHHFRDGNGCQRAMEVLLSLFPRIETALTKYGFIVQLFYSQHHRINTITRYWIEHPVISTSRV